MTLAIQALIESEQQTPNRQSNDRHSYDYSCGEGQITLPVRLNVHFLQTFGAVALRHSPNLH
jgi:hypothetical protein